MNNRYLYRAKRTDNGEWVEGLLARYDERFEVANIVSNEILIPVIASTICQCTGLKDKNGKLIWENDIVKKEFYTDYDAFANSEEYIGVVKYEDCAWCVSYERDGHKCNSPIFMAMEYHDAEHFNVIGNIFDNPELLE